MSFRSSFSHRKTKPRKFISRSPLKLPAEELAREFGPQYQTIDARIGNQKVSYDLTRGEWIADGTVGPSISFREMTKLEQTKGELEEKNNALRVKVDTLLEMLAEITAEFELRRAA